MNDHTTDREAYARKVVADFANKFWDARAQQVDAMWRGSSLTLLLNVPWGAEWFEQGASAKMWLFMARAGLGLVERPSDPDEAGELAVDVCAICQTLAEYLFQIPGDNLVTIPDSWASHPMGELWHKAMIWALGDDLITIAEAAKLAGVSTQAIHGRIARGSLQTYIDPSAPAHQGRRLVRRTDVLPPAASNQSA